MFPIFNLLSKVVINCTNLQCIGGGRSSMRGVPGEGESFRKEAADLRKVGGQPRTTGGALHLNMS